jgi:molybdate transport system ATP-binding protein
MPASTASPGLEIRAEQRLGAFRLDLDLRAPSRGVTALFGTSGAGKTSLVNMLAGLARPARGRIVLDGTVLFDSDGGIDLPANRRRLGYVFQEGRLFPHLSVRGNLLYGYRRAPRGERTLQLDEIVELLGVGQLLARRPGRLSGGEKQRVAIGRALLAQPRLLLMDEPLASLDAARKDEILPFIERLRDRVRLPIVYVTHDLREIIRLADTVALVEDGRVTAVGTVDEILARGDLRSLTGGYDAGALLRARVESHDERFGLTHLAFDGGRLRTPRLDAAIGAEVRINVRARDVSIALTPPRDVSILNIVPARVGEIIAGDGGHVDVQLMLGQERRSPIWARLTARSVYDLQLVPGRGVFALIKAVAIDRHSMAEVAPYP